ncbi:alpha-N-acetylglucosaminidase [Mucilaginibacter yixingensis]|uniref:Alpha-N-acetylglucosaminidase n=1 Tax=Mucilaginibacter yixingensis TaxID=1295612 RepID=A0A2T5JFF5_9SPHI|nr:alpha-N-acetylglucosaminidase [Mucilaginibacter yixingensis]PTR01170.1 alpha-N-acetylglucosaminidase [Mucilaginibacter yixingensis]
MKRGLLTFGLALATLMAQAQSVKEESAALIKRLLPGYTHSFTVETIAAPGGSDRFEVESRNSKIILRGNNGVSVASALYYYLTNYAHCQVTWNGTNLHLPAKLPMVPRKVVKDTPYKLRYYLNYCTFNYSMSWWDWSRWEKEIDWMALHGINMPLAITGEEYTWYQVYKDLGFTDNELKGFFSGPAYFSWFWMGNLDGWGGPLPQHWMESHFELQKKILARERALGMKPVLPAFTGHVPAAFKEKFPQAKLKATNWKNGFADTYILNSEDPMFARLGKLFLQKQTQLMGTDHYYSADTFNENEPPSDEPEYLSKLSARVYDGMHQVDTAAVWVMQGWLFFSDRQFWREPQTEALLKAVPDNKMLILDLVTEVEPVWKRTRAFYGKPWIWNMLNNFGGNSNLFGRMQEAAQGPALAMKDPNRGKMTGIGLTMEAIEQNPVLYELLTDNTWRHEPINLNEWLPQYIRNRYGKSNTDALKAWEILRKTVYTVPADKYVRDGAESILQARPTLDTFTRWTATKSNYRAQDLLPAWQGLIKAAQDLKNSDGYQFDVVDVTRQVLANYALTVQRKWVDAYRQKNQADFKKYTTQFITLMDDLDVLLATRKDFMLGPWIATARNCGIPPQEKHLYEQNAKDLITLWGDKDCPLHEYACRQWSGLISDFYKPRWQQYFAQLSADMQGKKTFDADAFDKQIKNWEWQWVNARKDYPLTPQGNSVDKAKQIYAKYWPVITLAIK